MKMDGPLYLGYLILLSSWLCLWPSDVRSENPASISSPGSSPGETVTVELLPETLDPEGQQIASIAINPTGEILAAGGLDGTLRLWDMKSCKLIKALKRVFKSDPDQGVYVTAVAFSPDGRWLAAGGRDWAIRLWTPASIPQTHESFKLLGHPGHVRSLAFDPRGKVLASAGQGGVIKFWTIGEKVEELASILGSTDLIFSIAYSPDGHFLVSGGNEGAVRLWDTRTKKLLRRIEAPVPVRGVAYSPTGELIATAIEESGEDRPSVMVWQAQTGKLLFAHRGHRDGLGALSVTFSPDGKQVISGGKDGKIIIWDIPTQSKVLEIEIEESSDIDVGVTALALSSNGQQIVSGGYGLLPHVWDRSSGKVLKVFRGATCNPSP